MTSTTTRAALLALSMTAWAVAASAQAVAGPEKARPVAGDPGLSSMVVLELPQFRVLRDYAEPKAVRRMHNHAEATFHVFVLVTGQLELTVQGEPMVVVHQGEALSLKGGVMHTFTNTGAVAATIVEVFGKAPAAAADLAAAEALARALAQPAPRR